METGKCAICGYFLAGASSLCQRCCSMSWEARQRILSERALAESILKLVQALEIRQEDELR